MSAEILLAEALGICIGGGFLTGCVVGLIQIYGSRLKCYQTEHLKFYYAGNSVLKWWHEPTGSEPWREHVWWCGRCGYESSDEAECRKALRDYGYAGPGYAVKDTGFE